MYVYVTLQIRLGNKYVYKMPLTEFDPVFPARHVLMQMMVCHIQGVYGMLIHTHALWIQSVYGHILYVYRRGRW